MIQTPQRRVHSVKEITAVKEKLTSSLRKLHQIGNIRSKHPRGKGCSLRCLRLMCAVKQTLQYFSDYLFYNLQLLELKLSVARCSVSPLHFTLHCSFLHSYALLNSVLLVIVIGKL